MNYRLFIFLIIFFCGCGVKPDKIYTVYNVTDSSGKTYYNLNRYMPSPEHEYYDQQGKTYIFHGNHTVISSTISGYDIFRLRTEKE